jgi:cyclophilin family peptidyl-prolyl cis-trans isomerase/protein-disulfide isomerase
LASNGILGLSSWLRTSVAAGVIALSACSPLAVQPTATAEIPTTAPSPNPNLGCTIIETPPTPSAASVIPPVSASDYSSGPEDAAVTLLLYCDLQSAECEIFNRVLDQLLEDHPGDLRVVHRLFPVPASAVPTLDKSELASQAAIAAGNQGAFWDLRQLLHEKHAEWASLSLEEFRPWMLDEAATLDVDIEQYRLDLESPATQAAAQAAYKDAVSLGITSIPTIFVNGRLQARAAMSYSGLESTVGLILLAERQYRTCPPFEIDTTASYIATLHTEKGDIIIRLFADRAPLAVNSFVFLSRNGWFDGTTFHRVLPGFVAQGGDPSGTGHGGPGYYFNSEVYYDLLFDQPGVVAMANSGPDTNGSQFFITFAPEPQLDGSYSIFGQVSDGMRVVESLTPRNTLITPGQGPGDRIISVTIETR